MRRFSAQHRHGARIDDKHEARASMIPSAGRKRLLGSLAALARRAIVPHAVGEGWAEPLPPTQSPPTVQSAAHGSVTSPRSRGFRTARRSARPAASAGPSIHSVVDAIVHANYGLALRRCLRAIIACSARLADLGTGLPAGHRPRWSMAVPYRNRPIIASRAISSRVCRR